MTMLREILGILGQVQLPFGIGLMKRDPLTGLPRILGHVPERPRRVYGCRHRVKKVNRLHVSSKAKARQRRRARP
jgi:hypothetical protein